MSSTRPELLEKYLEEIYNKKYIDDYINGLIMIEAEAIDYLRKRQIDQSKFADEVILIRKEIDNKLPNYVNELLANSLNDWFEKNKKSGEAELTIPQEILFKFQEIQKRILNKFINAFEEQRKLALTSTMKETGISGDKDEKKQFDATLPIDDKSALLSKVNSLLNVLASTTSAGDRFSYNTGTASTSYPHYRIEFNDIFKSETANILVNILKSNGINAELKSKGIYPMIVVSADEAIKLKDEKKFARVKDALHSECHKKAEEYYIKATNLEKEGKKEKLTEAAAMYKMAVQLGHVKAKTNLGYFLLHGLGGLTQDKDKAFEFILAGAQANHARAQLYMAEMFEKGNGVTKDSAMAKIWYEKCAQNTSDQVAPAKAKAKLSNFDSEVKSKESESKSGVHQSTRHDTRESILESLFPKGCVSVDSTDDSINLRFVDKELFEKCRSVFEKYVSVHHNTRYEKHHTFSLDPIRVDALLHNREQLYALRATSADLKGKRESILISLFPKDSVSVDYSTDGSINLRFTDKNLFEKSRPMFEKYLSVHHNTKYERNHILSLDPAKIDVLLNDSEKLNAFKAASLSLHDTSMRRQM